MEEGKVGLSLRIVVSLAPYETFTVEPSLELPTKESEIDDKYDEIWEKLMSQIEKGVEVAKRLSHK